MISFSQLAKIQKPFIGKPFHLWFYCPLFNKLVVYLADNLSVLVKLSLLFYLCWKVKDEGQKIIKYVKGCKTGRLADQGINQKFKKQKINFLILQKPNSSFNWFLKHFDHFIYLYIYASQEKSFLKNSTSMKIVSESSKRLSLSYKTQGCLPFSEIFKFLSVRAVRLTWGVRPIRRPDCSVIGLYVQN